MAPRSSRNLKTKEVKIPHLTVANRKKMETWGLGGLFAVDWNGTYEDLVEELLSGREIAAVEKTVSRHIKALGACNEATCIGPYLVHLYNYFHDMDAEEKEDSKKQKALIQTISDSDTKTKMEDEKEPKEEVPRAFCEGEASGSKPLDQKIMIDYEEWGICLESLGHETSKLFEAFHVEVGNVIAEAVAQNMKEIFAPPLVVEADIQPWKEMVKNLAKLFTEEQKRNKEIIEQRDYYEGNIRHSEKVPEIAMWCGQ
ncbi:hypothetical protein R1flu_007535 [Riccia fluitans]|uniref:Uncharacterized protein n=1 Tax=Riccia fluitans TaxID=41844 RepID=A0ABD1YZ80_9MARC